LASVMAVSTQDTTAAMGTATHITILFTTPIPIPATEEDKRRK